MRIPEGLPRTERALYTARSYVGVRERGHNRGPEVEMFLRTAGGAPGMAWCAAFVYHCCIEAGIPANVLPRKGLALAVRNWRTYFKQLPLAQARRGMLVGWLNPNQTGHIGFIIRVHGNTIVTIEGNTNSSGSREGDGVYEKRRTIASLNQFHRPFVLDLHAVNT